jgi:hypothetical protein
MKQLTALGECGGFLTAGIPIMQSFYRCLLRNGKGMKGKIDERNFGYYQFTRSAGFELQHRPITEEARFSFYLSFNIPPDLQRCLENHYDNLTISPHAVQPEGDIMLPPWLDLLGHRV